MLATEKLILKIVCRPFLGRHVFVWVPVSTFFVKLLVRFWSVGVRVEGQKIADEKSSEKVLVGGVVELFDSF